MMALVMESCSEPNFSFAFNDSHFSDMLLHIEVMPDPPPKSDTVTTIARHCKNSRRQDVLDHTTNEQFFNGNQPDMDDGVLYENQDEETSVIPSVGETVNNNDSNRILDCSTAIVVRVNTLHISSAILAAKSSFFYELCTNGVSESKQRHITLRINASEEAAFMELLKFMYSNTLNITAPPALLDVVMVADKFEVSSCMRYLLNSSMTLDSALLYLELPHTVDAVQPLIDVAKKYLIGRYKKITIEKFEEELMALPLSGIEAILASDDLEVESEEDVYDFTLDWARQKYKSLKKRQEILGTRLARLIRFPYMTRKNLKDVLTWNDFKHEGASKLVLEALSFKAEAPNCQRSLAAEESISLSRRFVVRAYKITMDMCLTREECVAMFPSGYVDSEPFRFCGQIFYIIAICEKPEHGSSHCFSLGLGIKRRCSGSIVADYEFKVRLSPSYKLVSLLKSNHTFIPGTYKLNRNPFKISWASFIAEDSFFFLDDFLHIRAKLSIAH